jgi:hypothetical protein
MPTEIHDCVQEWLTHQSMVDWFANGILTQQEQWLLKLRVGTSKLSYDLLI